MRSTLHLYRDSPPANLPKPNRAVVIRHADGGLPVFEDNDEVTREITADDVLDAIFETERTIVW